MSTRTRSMVRSVLGPVLTWPAVSQHTARRNALVASTALAQQRHEWLEVERFLEQQARRRTTSAAPERTAARA
jgi:hypothetical protein